MTHQYVIRLENENATVEVDGRIYKDGDTFVLPSGWKPDPEFTEFIKRPSFSYETKRRVRNSSTGQWEDSIDVKRVSLPVVVVPESVPTAIPFPAVEEVEEDDEEDTFKSKRGKGHRG